MKSTIHLCCVYITNKYTFLCNGKNSTSWKSQAKRMHLSAIVIILLHAAMFFQVKKMTEMQCSQILTKLKKCNKTCNVNDKESPNEPTMPCVKRVPYAPSLKPVFECYNTITGHLCNIVTFKRRQKSMKTIIKVWIFQYHLNRKNLDLLLGWSSAPSSLELPCLGHFSHYFDSSCKHQ